MEPACAGQRRRNSSSVCAQKLLADSEQGQVSLLIDFIPSLEEICSFQLRTIPDI
jgi:hypothetical protein